MTVVINQPFVQSLFQKMGLEEDFAAAAEDISNNVNKTLSDDELKEVET